LFDIVDGGDRERGSGERQPRDARSAAVVNGSGETEKASACGYRMRRNQPRLAEQAPVHVGGLQTRLEAEAVVELATRAVVSAESLP